MSTRRVTVLGAGSWGTALSKVAASAGHLVSLWARDASLVSSINSERVNPRYLSSCLLPPGVQATVDVQPSLEGAELIVLAVPSHAARVTLKAVAETKSVTGILVGATKGLEVDSGKRMSQVAAEILGESFPFVCLSGPSFAQEVVLGHPTAIVAAGNSEHAEHVQTTFSCNNLRVYTNSDLVGVELGGSVKNVMAIAAGMVSGLGFGSNSIAALITRGLAEMTRLALRQGARLETLMGLSGLGDLVLTCTGTLSRNRFVGQELGRGRNLDEICSGMSEVAEGIRTTAAVKRLAESLKIDMPITREVHAVLYERKSPRDAVKELMTRPLRSEFD
ncbi:MAG TPA: NAD(P)H-dependent glycerol-3-phosphate dehydrogenase [Pyrinomonadaceae bacterium]|nr:NAD(P)H-dependent glycerol-3-phosphate dehydrogenase [Pyrinomonadaceae bacterium]